LKLSDIIFVPSVQHTGTWFILKLLKQFNYNIVDSKRLLEDGMSIDNPSIIQTHFPIESVDGKPFELGKCMDVNSISAMSKIFKTVIPVRDPLASILTREVRHPELRHFYIVDGFINMAERLAKNSKVFFFPVDLPELCRKRMEKAGETEEEIEMRVLNMRKLLIINVLNHCDIEIEEGKVDRIASRWTPENETPNNVFKPIYQERDKERLEYLLGSKMAEVTYLKNKASIILPFLAKLGYTKGDLNLW
jgi:hypothetical protein